MTVTRVALMPLSTRRPATPSRLSGIDGRVAVEVTLAERPDQAAGLAAGAVRAGAGTAAMAARGRIAIPRDVGWPNGA